MRLAFPKALPTLLMALPLIACDGSVRLELVEMGGSHGLTLAGAPSEAGSLAASGGSGGVPEPAAGAPDQPPTAGMPNGPAWEAAPLYRASYVSYAYPGQYMRHIGAEGFIGAIDPANVDDTQAASFEMIPGVWDDGCVSFRVVTEPGVLFRHSGSRLYVHPVDNVPLYLADATFCPEPSTVDPAGLSFRSVNYPQRFIHLRNLNELWIDDIVDTPEFASESTFYREPALDER